MKTKLFLLISFLMAISGLKASDPYYYELISNPDKTIDYVIGFYTSGYSIGRATDDKDYVIYKGAVINNSSKSLNWNNYYAIVQTKKGDLIFSYKTAAKSGDYASEFTVSPSETHHCWFAFHEVFKPEDIQHVYLFNDNIVKSYLLVKSDASSSYDNSSSSSSSGCSYFPLYGVMLGKTPVSDLANKGTRSKEPYTYYTISGQNFWYENGVADHMYMTYTDNMPEQWKACGFDWAASYNEWVSMLKDKGFTVTITKSPESKLYDGRQTLSAEVKAVKYINDADITFKFKFDYGDSDSLSGRKTLYSISLGI